MDQKNVPPQGEQGAPAQPPLLVLQIIWVAMLFSVGTYVGLSFIVPLGGDGAMDTRVLELVFTVVALGLLAMSFVLPRRMLASAVAQGPGAGKDPAAMPLNELIAKAKAPWIVRLAMCEAVAVFGLVLVFLSHRPMKIVPFAALSILAMLAAFPTESSLRRAAER
jgi:hypothetical protein